MTPKEIKSVREKLGLTQQAFATAMHVSFASVNRWENGVSKPGKLAIDRMRDLNNRAWTGQHPQDQNFTQLVDKWTGRLVLAIGAGKFRDEVAIMLSTVMRDAHERTMAQKKERYSRDHS